MKHTVHVHVGGQKEVCSIELAEQETAKSLIARLVNEGHLKTDKREECSVWLEDTDEEVPWDILLEPNKHKRVHIGRCKKINVKVIFNGKPEEHEFAPGVTLRRVTDWAREKFGVDKKEKLVLRLNDTASEPLDPDSHVGSYASFPSCGVTFYLTPKIKIEG